MTKTILFRVDASSEIGFGHLMRCLTLANAAKLRGWCVRFAIRLPSDEVIKLVRQFNYALDKIDGYFTKKTIDSNKLQYSHWLDITQSEDAEATNDIIDKNNIDWIVVDHYALDSTWHDKVRRHCTKILVVDDLADRELSCSILVNQNLGFSDKNYANLTMPGAQHMLGPEYAILRSEFGLLRDRAIIRRHTAKIKRILVSMGGADTNDFTYKVLLQLSNSNLAKRCEFIVVTGPAYENRSGLIKFCRASELNIKMKHNVENMAELMTEADLCIGASGTTNWERCCLALPTIIIPIAQNQVQIATSLEESGAVIKSSLINLINDFESLLIDNNRKRYLNISNKARALCDGSGSIKVIEAMENYNEN